MTPSQLLAHNKALIRREGEPVVVTRRPSTVGGSVTTQTLYCRPQPLATGDVSRLQSLGILNVQEDNPYAFVFAGDADVREMVDSIAHGGLSYRVVNANPQRKQGIAVALHVIATRDGVAGAS